MKISKSKKPADIKSTQKSANRIDKNPRTMTLPLKNHLSPLFPVHLSRAKGRAEDIAQSMESLLEQGFGDGWPSFFHQKWWFTREKFGFSHQKWCVSIQKRNLPTKMLHSPAKNSHLSRVIMSQQQVHHEKKFGPGFGHGIIIGKHGDSRIQHSYCRRSTCFAMSNHCPMFLNAVGWHSLFHVEVPSFWPVKYPL